MFKYIYCCQIKPNNITKQQYYCEKCNKEIGYKTALYGSGLCGSCAVKKRLKKSENNPNYKEGKYSKNYHNYCIDCGKEITRGKSKRCMSCAVKYLFRNNKLNRNGVMNGAYKDGRMSKQHHCIEPHCNNEICYTNWLYGSKLCKSCSVKGKLHPNYIDGNGYLPYSVEFTDKLRNVIKERDSYTCQCCGMTQKEHFKKYNRDIEVHHIDYNKYNCEEDNLITLCKYDNIKANFNKDYWYAYYSYKIENYNE